MVVDINGIMKIRRVQLLAVAILVFGILPLVFFGLEFGRDFTGGTVLSVKLERQLTVEEQQSVINVMQSRLNTFGLKDVRVVPFGKDFVLIEIAETDQEAINQLQNILSQQGKFETLFKGNIVLTGSGIVSVTTNPQRGYGVRGSVGGGYAEWVVPFLLSTGAADKFADAIEGQCTLSIGGQTCQEQLYMFIDRPEDAVVIMTSEMAQNESQIPEDFAFSSTLISLEELVQFSQAELIVTDSIDASVIDRVANKTVVVKPGTFNATLLAESAAKVIEKDQIGPYWITGALNIENIVHVTPSITAGTPVLEPTITGSAPTQKEAQQELERVAILLKSGKLPVSVAVGGVSTISPILGGEFLYYSLLAGLAAIVAVALVIFLRYRRLVLTVPIIATVVSELILILGLASLIRWQIDLAAVAGIIAAVGTGVDHLILITDEALRKEGEATGVSLVGKIKKAFGVIMMAAATTIFAMLPLLFVGLGVLKGFAITTIIGSLIGVGIARPAYGQVINKLL